MPKIVGIDHSGNPIGTILPIAYDSVVPVGTLLCDGSSISRTTYAHLFTVLGTIWGSVDGSHFNLPDLRGKFLRGRDHAAGNDPDSAGRTAQSGGGATGDAVGSIQVDQVKTHTHTLGPLPNKWGNGASSGTPAWGEDNATNGSSTATTNTTGGNETRPLNAYANYVIAYI